MTILIYDITREFDGSLLISGKTDIGPIAGVWRSMSVEPKAGESYDCEIFLPVLDGKDIIARREPLSPCYTEVGIDNRIHFKGLCEAIEGDNIVVSFGSDWVECFEFSGLKVSLYDSILFSVAREDVDIYPLDLF